MTVREACFVVAAHQHHHNNDREQHPSPALLRWSPFAVVCIMHMFATRLWHVSHETLSSAATRLPADAGAAAQQQQHAAAAAAAASASCQHSALASGRRCNDLIRAHADRIDEQDPRRARAARDARWQLADAGDVLRVCYCRAVPALARLDCDTLLRGGAEDVRVAVEEHVAAPVARCAEFTVAAAVAFEGLCVPLRYGGAQLYRKTGALSGSLEHLVAGWDNGEFMLVRSSVHL